MHVAVTALSTEPVRAIQRGGLDAYGLPPERRISDGRGVPCRHCLRTVAAGKDYLVLAWRPFPAVQAFAETGPILLCAEECDQAEPEDALPSMMDGTPDYIVRGYNAADQIVYGTGAVVPTETILKRAGQLFDDPAVAYVHVRSSRNNCYQCRVDRMSSASSAAA